MVSVSPRTCFVRYNNNTDLNIGAKGFRNKMRPSHLCPVCPVDIVCESLTTLATCQRCFF